MSEMDEIERIAQTALDEDVGAGDLTSRLVVPADMSGTAEIRAENDLTLAGMEAAQKTFFLVDPDLKFIAKAWDGDRLARGAVIAEIAGRLRSLLAAERVALNFIQRASGVATLTAEYVRRVRGYKAKILDTRKTAPGLRVLDKAAVKAGGGFNHRFGLFDAVLIKDNHIVAAGGVRKAVVSAKRDAPENVRIEIEATNLDELSEAIEAGADIVMLDNMTPAQIAEAVRATKGRVLLEASGGVNLETVAQIAATGVDYISVGALTHSAPAADISMDIKKP